MGSRPDRRRRGRTRTSPAFSSLEIRKFDSAHLINNSSPTDRAAFLSPSRSAQGALSRVPPIRSDAPHAHVEPRRFRRPRARDRGVQRGRHDADDWRRIGAGRVRVHAAVEAFHLSDAPLGPVRLRDGPLRARRSRRAPRLLAGGLRRLQPAPLPAAGDGAVQRRHLRHLAFSLRAQDDGDHRPVLRSANPDYHQSVAPAADGRAPEPLWADQHLLPDPHQSIPGGARGAAQLLHPGFRQRHPGSRRTPSGRVLAPAVRDFHAAGDVLDPGVPHRVLRLPQLRPAMAALDDGLLHLPLAPARDALQARAQGRRHRQPGPAHFRGHRRLHQRRRGRRRLLQRRHLQLHEFRR